MPTITPQEAFTAIAQLLAEDVTITNEEIIRRIGRGSKRDIGPLRQLFDARARAHLSQTTALPPETQDLALAFAEKLHDLVSRESESRIRQLEYLLSDARHREAEAERRERRSGYGAGGAGDLLPTSRSVPLVPYLAHAGSDRHRAIYGKIPASSPQPRQTAPRTFTPRSDKSTCASK